METPIPDTAVCLGCGYALRGLPEARCPECGRGFDPGDPDSFGPRPGLWGRSIWDVFASPPPVWHLVLVVVLTLGVVDGASVWIEPLGGSTFGPCLVFNICMAPLGLLVVVFDYTLRAIAVGVKLRRPGPARLSRLRHDKRRWLVTPICFGVLISLVAYPWPLHVRFAMSRSAFERAAAANLAGTGTATVPRWLGLYKVEGIGSDVPGTVCFFTGESISDPIGFVFDPASPPARRYRYRVTPE